MSRMSLRQPHILFQSPLPPPRPWLPVCPVLSSASTARAQLHWSQSSPKDRTFPRVLGFLEDSLRIHYRRKVLTCVDESQLSSVSPAEYLLSLLLPVVDVFNQLPHTFLVQHNPVRCMRVELDGSVCGATFSVETPRGMPVTAPVILAMPGDLFNIHDEPSPAVRSAVAQTIEQIPSVPSIVVSNFNDIAVFLPPTPSRGPKFEKLQSTQPVMALRLVSAAYLLDALPRGFYLQRASPDLEIDEALILPQGPPEDPSRPLASDEEVFTTHRCNSDFDVATLVRDRERALQFFRWHAHVKSRHSKVVAHEGDDITVVTNETGQAILADVRPFSSFDVSEIPRDTSEHLKAIQRDCHLVTSGIDVAFWRSKGFTVKILGIIAEGSEFGICTVYRCQIISVDGESVASPDLCLKLFDDRFQPLTEPDEDESKLDERVPRWFDRVIIAEVYALNEAAAYNKLQPVQGSIVPWFYGTHQFTLPDGTVLYGILIEYIEGCKLGSASVREMSADTQVDMIRSCRHGARVLDIADVSQRDWHRGQIILSVNTRHTEVNHAVLIDFASTTQTFVPEDLNHIDNYFGTLYVLLDKSGLDSELVWKHFGLPDDWDDVRGIMSVQTARGVEMRVIPRPKPLFSFVSIA